ncbi:MAG: endonuclease domain-containing protein [Clostridia bacterium]|nr:endonuclease domain-containing protein [Clostridia bacterium]
MSEIDYKHNPKLTPNARELRKNMTKEEKQLWYNYLRKCKVRFLRQKVIDNYIVDFYCSKLNLVIELDGSQHYEDKGLKYDKIRTKKLENRQLTVIRIPNNEIWHNFDGVCEYIDNYIEIHLG